MKTNGDMIYFLLRLVKMNQRELLNFCWTKTIVLIRKLNLFLGHHRKSFLFRRCLNLYKSEEILTLHEPKRERYNIITIRISSESHFHCKNHFHKNPLSFKIIANFFFS